MAAVSSVLKRHPLIAFFVLAYALSWGSYWLLSGPTLFPFGPFLAALIVAGASRGWGGLKELSSRTLRWRVGVKWYVAAIVLPIAMAVTAVIANILLGAPQPPAASLTPGFGLLLLLPLALVDAPLWEETGWRGYALSKFPAARSPLATTLLLGLLVAGWHLPIALSERALTVPYLIAAVASAVIINWIYYNARQSALPAIVFHSAQNAIGGFYLFKLFGGPGLVSLWWLLAGIYCAVAIALMLNAEPYRSSRHADPS